MQEQLGIFFFEKSNQNYLITGILNNYSEEAKEI
ncbi:hypothetical protein BSF41_11040 [Flavobacterium sp. ACN2]|nr:hypothetical protein BSF41_11040 [Flavobacterium sp. ACN2]